MDELFKFAKEINNYQIDGMLKDFYHQIDEFSSAKTCKFLI